MNADRWWDEARNRARLAVIRDRRLNGREFDAALELIASPEWVPERGQRKMPSKWAIASYWAKRDDWFEVFIDQPHCFACGLHGGYPEDEPDLEYRWNQARRLERGHIVNWARHGLDGVQNLVPLCGDCNHFMPVFGVEDDIDATMWIFGGGLPGMIEKRLEGEGMNWAERGLAWLEWMQARGGVVMPRRLDPDGYERFLLRQLPSAA